MLSDNLKSLSAHFRGWAAAGGVQLDHATCVLLSLNLEADVLLAQAIEGRTGQVVRFDGSQPHNVVPIDRARIRASFLPGIGQGGAA